MEVNALCFFYRRLTVLIGRPPVRIGAGVRSGLWYSLPTVCFPLAPPLIRRDIVLSRALNRVSLCKNVP